METTKKLQCEFCDKLFKSDRGLATHRQTHLTGSEDAEKEGFTPKTNVTRFLTCGVCSKQYKTSKNLEKHLLSHSDGAVAQTPGPTITDTPSTQDFDEAGFWTDDLIQNFHEEYMEDLPDVFVAEDEEEDARRQNVETQEEEISGRSKPKSQRPPALVYCSICKNDKNIRNKKRGFNSIDQFLIHRKRHAMQDAYARAPSLQRAKMECLIIGQETLSKLEETNLNRPIAQEMKRLAKLLKDNLFSDSVKQFFELMCDVFMSCFLEGRDFFLLSKLTEAYLSNVASKCADIEVRNNLLILLSPLVESSHINMFLASIMRHFSQLLLAFILRVMRQGENETRNETSLLGSRYVERSENTDSEESMQTMHYIGGANVKKILRVALRLRNPNEKSLSIIDTIRSNFLIVDLAEDTDERLMAWTEAQDRGGLCKINKKVLNFFVLLGKAIQPLERADGSLIVSEVIEKVSTSCDIISVWDEIIAGKLSEEVSFELLYELVCHFCVTFRNGIISRRLDEWACDQSQRGKNNKHGTGGVSFRARLA